MANIFLRMSVVFQNNIISLGMNAIESFEKVYGTEHDAVFIVDDEYIEKLKQMEVHLFGFTQEFKDKMIAAYEARKGQKGLITADWLMGKDSPRSQSFMKFVSLLNEGKEFEEAKEYVFNLQKLEQ